MLGGLQYEYNAIIKWLLVSCQYFKILLKFIEIKILFLKFISGRKGCPFGGVKGSINISQLYRGNVNWHKEKDKILLEATSYHVQIIFFFQTFPLKY
jgi:hypothetical protein